MCGEVGGRRGVVVAIRTSVLMHCAMVFWWGSWLRVLILRFDCGIPLVLLRDCFCAALQMTSQDDNEVSWLQKMFSAPNPVARHCRTRSVLMILTA